MIKTCVQILLITVAKVLQSNSEIAHGIVFSIIIIAFSIISYKFRAFNYSRCDLWEISSLIAVSYLSILATLSNAGDSTNIAWFICLCIGWLIIIVLTIYIQRKYLPILLVSPSKKIISKKVKSFYSIDHVGTLDKKTIEQMQKIQVLNQDKNDEVIDISKVVQVEDNHNESPNGSSSEEISEAVPIN